jgi:hypothetical protein
MASAIASWSRPGLSRPERSATVQANPPGLVISVISGCVRGVMNEQQRRGQCANTAGAGDPERKRDPMSKVTEMGTAQINGHDTITVELVETDETPTVVRARPASYTPRRFPHVASTVPQPPHNWRRSRGIGSCDAACVRARAQASRSIRAPVRVRRSISNLHLLATGGGHCPTTWLNTLRSL